MEIYIVRLYDEVWDCWENHAAFDTEEKAIELREKIIKTNNNALVRLQKIDVK